MPPVLRSTTSRRPLAHPLPPPPPATAGATLRKGSQGPAVVTAQKLLAQAGFNVGTADGKFGPKTLAAVKAFQKSWGLEADGVIGPRTWAALKTGRPTPLDPPVNTAPTRPTTPSTPASASDTETARAIGARLDRPVDLDTSASEKIWFLKAGAPGIKPKPLTEAEGRRLFFDGMLPLLSDKATFKAASPTVSQTPSWARSAPCAFSTSWRLEEALVRAGRADLAPLFANHEGLAVTHEVEKGLKNLGFTYYSKKDYVAPRGAIGCWSRYTFHGVKQHSGHIFSVLEDKGVDGKADRIADNNGTYDKVYGGSSGYHDGFWLPPGVYPQRRE